MQKNPKNNVTKNLVKRGSKKNNTERVLSRIDELDRNDPLKYKERSSENNKSPHSCNIQQKPTRHTKNNAQKATNSTPFSRNEQGISRGTYNSI